MSLLDQQIRHLIEGARPHAQAAMAHCGRLEDETALLRAKGALETIGALSERKRYGLLDQASRLISDLRDELVDLRKMKDRGYREHFKASSAEKECIRMLEIRYRVNGMEALKDAAEALKSLRFRIERTWSAPKKSLLPEHYRRSSACDDDGADDDEEDEAPISPLLLKLVARKNQGMSIAEEKGARPVRSARR